MILTRMGGSISLELLLIKPSRFSLIVAHPDLDWEVSGSSPGHTNDF